MVVNVVAMANMCMLFSKLPTHIYTVKMTESDRKGIS
jgi:hypothetical protein